MNLPLDIHTLIINFIENDKDKLSYLNCLLETNASGKNIELYQNYCFNYIYNYKKWVHRFNKTVKLEALDNIIRHGQNYILKLLWDKHAFGFKNILYPKILTHGSLDTFKFAIDIIKAPYNKNIFELVAKKALWTHLFYLAKYSKITCYSKVIYHMVRYDRLDLALKMYKNEKDINIHILKSAFQYGHLHIVKWCFKTLDLEKSYYKRFIYHAIARNHVNLLEWYVEMFMLDRPDIALSIAASNNHFEMAQMICRLFNPICTSQIVNSTIEAKHFHILKWFFGNLRTEIDFHSLVSLVTHKQIDVLELIEFNPPQKDLLSLLKLSKAFGSEHTTLFIKDKMSECRPTKRQKLQ